MIAQLPSVKPVTLPEFYSLLSTKGALKLESLGMRRSRSPSAASVARTILKRAGRKAPRSILELIAEFNTYVEQVKQATLTHENPTTTPPTPSH